MPEQCMAVLKPPGVTRAHRCPVPALPNEVYCPLHLVLEGRLKEIARKHRELLRYYREKRWLGK